MQAINGIDIAVGPSAREKAIFKRMRRPATMDLSCSAPLLWLIGIGRLPRLLSDRRGLSTGMDCICCDSAAVTERPEMTARGYRRFRCRDCSRQFNERSVGTLSRTCLQSDIIAFVVFCRLRYRLTLGDLSEILLLRGIEVSHETVRAWEAKLLPIMGDVLRKRRHGSRRQSGKSWYVDETCLRVRGRWTYLYRAIDRDGNLVDTMLSATRDMESANAFFRSAKATMGFTPERVTTDGHGSYPRAVRTILGTRVLHWTNVYLNNRLEQAHRGIKGRTRCMRGFKDHDAADRFYREYDELRDLPRARSRQHIPASRRRSRFLLNAGIALGIFQTA